MVVCFGQPIQALGVAKVLVSHHPEFVKDDLVVGFIHWGDYSVQKMELLRKLDPTIQFPLSYHLLVLAYVGLFEICKPRKGERVFVSAACGSVGNLVALLKEKLGFDDAFNYKEETDFKSTLQRYFPDGIDIYLDNVGAEMLEAAVANMNKLGRVAACGVIAEYTDGGKRAAPSMMEIIYKRIKIHGFIGTDHSNLHSDFISTIII
nr:NADPH-dependent oxidoreductase 2-alkenal reductase-like [Populus alba]